MNKVNFSNIKWLYSIDGMVVIPFIGNRNSTKFFDLTTGKEFIIQRGEGLSKIKEILALEHSYNYKKLHYDDTYSMLEHYVLPLHNLGKNCETFKNFRKYAQSSNFNYNSMHYSLSFGLFNLRTNMDDIKIVTDQIKEGLSIKHSRNREKLSN